MTDMVVCDTGLQMCRNSLFDHENEILSTGMKFNTMSEMKFFLQDYAVYHHRPYNVTHLDQELRYHVIYKNSCTWRLNTRKRQSDGKWSISKVVEPHTCLTNRGKENHQQLTARYLARRILGLVDDILSQPWENIGAYSWGSAVLAWTYHQLCVACRRSTGGANLGGCSHLLQVWCWERWPVGRPVVYGLPVSASIFYFPQT